MIRWDLPKKVRLFEVGPRDGLQNEALALPLEVKLQYIEALLASGIRDVEVGAFVREDRIPQMAASDQIFRSLAAKGWLDRKNLRLWALVPNEKGLDRAIESKCRSIGIFTGATNTFTQKNIGMTIDESLRVYEIVVARARKERMKVRAYISVCWGCPYEGKVAHKKVIKLARQLLELGVEQVSLGDTIGVAIPTDVVELLRSLQPEIKRDEIAGHFHDTRGTALPNCLAAVACGVSTLDSSSGGLGGCNFAPGASGNVATEDLVYMLEGMKIRTGVNLETVCEASRLAIQGLGRVPASKYLQAWLTKKMAPSA